MPMYDDVTTCSSLDSSIQLLFEIVHFLIGLKSLVFLYVLYFLCSLSASVLKRLSIVLSVL